MKLLIWTNMPNHYQNSLINELANNKIDVKVLYYQKVPKDRLKEGWSDYNELPYNQSYISNLSDIFKYCPDWKDRIHIIPGISSPFLLKLLLLILQNNIKWYHWSEPSFNRLIIISFLIKKIYGKVINKYSLGALGIGIRAMDTFRQWGVKENKIFFFPYSSNIINNNNIDKKIKEFKKSRLTFLYVGVLNRRKATDILIKTFNELYNYNNNVCLILVGREASNSYRRYTVKKNLENNILFYGSSNPDNLSEIYNSVDVFILPSRRDGWGVVVNEAIQHKKPVIVSSSCGSAFHLLENGYNGYCVNSNNIDSLYLSMKNYVDKPYLIKEHGEKSEEIFRLYNPCSNVKRLINIIKSTD